MDQCFRIALWMCLLIGYLQAKPVCTENSMQWTPVEFNMADLGFDLLLKEVTCGPNVTFTSPTNVQELCYTAALELFIKGLEKAEESCQGERIADTLDAFRNSYPENTACPLPPQCKWENKESRKVFAEYVKNMKTFVEQLNSHRSE